MFDLNSEVRNWCRSVHVAGLRRENLVTELEDHLHSIIEQMMNDGLSEQDAFHAAVWQMGDAGDLRSEFRKNRNGALTALCATESRISRWSQSISPKRAAMLQIVVALVFASMLLVSSAMIPDESDGKAVRNILLAIYWVPFSLLAAAGSRCGKNRSRCIKC